MPQTLAEQYFPILIQLILAFAMAGGLVGAGLLLGRRVKNKVKDLPYECGMTPQGTARERFSVKFYVVAILFVVFDIEAIFLYPWAVLLLPDAATGAPGLGWPGLVTMGIFVATLIAGLAYVWKKGVLDWSK